MARIAWTPGPRGVGLAETRRQPNFQGKGQRVRLGIVIGSSGAEFAIDMDYIREAESLGYDSAWTSESWGSDALTSAAWVLA